MTDEFFSLGATDDSVVVGVYFELQLSQSNLSCIGQLLNITWDSTSAGEKENIPVEKWKLQPTPTHEASG